MSISWTKNWSAADNGTIITGVDIKNLQDDIESSLTQNATSIQGASIAAPVAGDDNAFIQYDYSSNEFVYTAVTLTTGLTGILPLAKGGTNADLSSLTQGAIYYDNGTAGFTRLSPGTAGQVLATGGAGANPSWSSTGLRATLITSSTTWTCPVGVTKVFVTMCGGGGGGGGSWGSGGGGAGCILRAAVTVVSASGYGITVGTGGTAGTSGGGNGGNGGVSIFNTGGTANIDKITANGGAGGGGNAGAVGAGGAATTISFVGSDAVDTRTLTSSGGGFGISYAGGDGGLAFSGSGDYSGASGGGNIFGSGGNGWPVTAALGFGSGGAGGRQSTAGNAGTGGFVLIEYT